MTLVSVFRALVTSDVVTMATHCCCVPMFTTVIAMNVAFSVVDVVISVVSVVHNPKYDIAVYMLSILCYTWYN